MSTSDLIKKLCEDNQISIAELARRIGQSPQNLGKKLKRDTVSQSELSQIAEAFGVTYEQTFSRDNENMIDNSDELVEKYIIDELGVSISSFEEEKLDLDDTYIKLADTAFEKINSLFQRVPYYAAEIKSKRMSADAYRVIYDKGLGHLQQSAKNRDRLRANVVAYGTNNNILDQAELEKIHLKVSSPALVAFDIAAIATNQYYLARIDNKLISLDNKLNYVQKFLEESKKSDLWANGQFLRDVSSKIYEITEDDQYRLATLTTIQGIRKDALSNVKFYHKMMTDYVENHFDKKIKNFDETKDVLKRFYDCFDAYCYSVYVYGFAYVIEIALSQITDKTFLSKVEIEISSVVKGFQNDYTQELKQFIDSAKSLNEGTLTKIFSGSSPVFAQSYGSLWASLLFDFVVIGANIAANHDKDKKNNRKDEVVKEYKRLQQRTEKSISELDAPINAIKSMSGMFNEPVELVIKDNAAYLRIRDEKKAE